MDWSDLDFTAESETVAPLTLPSIEERLREAVECACSRERIGTSPLQRTLGIGYGRAAALMDRMEELGIVGPDPGDKTGREVLLSLEEALARLPAEETVIVSPSHTQARVDPPVLSPSEMLRKAVEVTCSRERIGTAVLQRTVRIGYSRAVALIDQMEELGIVGPDPGDKSGREVLLSLEEALARLPAEDTVIVSPSHTQARVDPPVLSPSEMLRKAVEVACSRERIGPSALQRSMQLGYGRAATLINQMEELGIIGPDPCDKTGREVLLTLEEALARLPAEEN
jgi:DNA segregation ATPase FtsK/SpoIIIE-like protein